MAVLGGLLIVGALLSSISKRSFLSLTALFVVAGFLLGDGGFDVLHFAPRSGFVYELAIVALVVILFRDGLEVDREMLPAWRLPLRKLVFAMPITAAIVAVVTHLFTDLDWTQSFLVGALLSPTDPVLSSSVVTNPRVPARIRHSLNLESGLNDGLALPPVLALVPRSTTTTSPGGRSSSRTWGWAWSTARRSASSRRSTCRRRHRALALRARLRDLRLRPDGAAAHGNGFISVFVCAIVLGVRRPDVREAFVRRAEDIVEIVKLGIFVVFGALLTFDALFTDGWAAVGIVAVLFLVARPVAVWIALAGTKTPWDAKAFMAWFGPRAWPR